MIPTAGAKASHCRSAFVLIVAVLACTAASCGPTKPRYQCAFADPEFTTLMGICDIAAEYYIAKHEWPVSKGQLQEQVKNMLAEEKAKISADELTDLSAFFERFTLIDLRKKGQNLTLHVRFKVESKMVDKTLTFKPASTADEILRTAMN